MKSSLNVWLSLVLSIGWTMQAYSESPFVRELGQLNQQKEKAVFTATDPILRRYIGALEVLLKKATQGNDLDAALLIKKELEAAKLMVPGLGIDVLPTMTGKHETKGDFIVSKDEEGLRTETTFTPPIEIEYVVKTDSQVRVAYAAEQIIFNWEMNKSELRVNGGPVANQQKPGAGSVPTNQFITIKQVVSAGEMSFFVDGRERARWVGDFSKVNDPIRIFGTHGATLELKQITVRKPK